MPLWCRSLFFLFLLVPLGSGALQVQSELASEHVTASSAPASTGAATDQSMRRLAKNCIKGVKDSWSDTVKQLIVDPYKYLAQTSPEATRRYLDECDQHIECKLKLYFEAHGTSPSGRDREALQRHLGTGKMDLLARQARSRMNSSGEQDRRLIQELENRKWVNGQYSRPEISQDPSQDYSSFWVSLYEKIKAEGGKAFSDPELFCYYLAQIVDPAIAASLITKSAKLQKIITLANRGLGETEQLAKADKVAQSKILAKGGIDWNVPAAVISPQETQIRKMIEGVNASCGMSNCVSTAITSEFRWQGKSVSAVSDTVTPHGAIISAQSLNDMGIQTYGQMNGLTMKELNAMVHDMTDGQRAIIVSQEAGAAHAFNAIRIDGKSFFYDAQNGQVFERASYQTQDPRATFTIIFTSLGKSPW